MRKDPLISTAFLLVLIFFVYDFSVSAQSVKAGIIDTNMTLITTFSRPYVFSTQINYPDTILLDLNQDSTVDLRVIALAYDLFQSSRTEFFFMPESGVELMSRTVDTCFSMDSLKIPLHFYSMCGLLPSGSTISGTSRWSDSALFYSYISSYSGPIPLGHFCYGGLAYVTDSIDYIGIRQFNGLDTTYGWLSVTKIAYDTLQILAIGMEDNSLRTAKVRSLDNFISIYPSPVKVGQLIKIKSQKFITGLSLYTLDGRLITQSLKENCRDCEVEVPNIESGILMLHLTGEFGHAFERIIVIK